MKYIFSKRQIRLKEDTEITVGNNNANNGSSNLSNMQSDLNKARSQNPGKTNFGADSENYNSNSNDNDGQLDLTVTGSNAKEMTDKVKSEISKTGVNPYRDAFNRGKLRIHGVKQKLNNSKAPKPVLEKIILTKKQFDKYLKR